MSKPTNTSQYPREFQQEIARAKNWFNSLPISVRQELWGFWRAEQRRLSALSFETVCKSETCIRAIWKHSGEPLL